MSRKMIDCRRMPSERNCSVAISGTEEEVLAIAVRHAIDVFCSSRFPLLVVTLSATRGEEVPAPDRPAGEPVCGPPEKSLLPAGGFGIRIG